MARVSAPSILNSESGLARYLQETWHFPLLRPQEEIELATRWRKYGDRDAGDRLVTSHLRLVVSIAAGYRGYGLPAGEIISEGNGPNGLGGGGNGMMGMGGLNNGMVE